MIKGRSTDPKDNHHHHHHSTTCNETYTQLPFGKKLRPTTTPGDQAKHHPNTTTTPAGGDKTQEPKSTTTSTPPNSGGSPSQSDITQYLDGHNNFRKQHDAQALTWSDTLASTAQAWAQKCVWKHSEGQYGENLAAGIGLDIPYAIKMWTDEQSQYDSSNPQASHYTQVVWKNTKELGCAVVSCNLSIFDPSFGPANYYVCEYNPPGNVVGEYAQNVS